MFGGGMTIEVRQPGFPSAAFWLEKGAEFPSSSDGRNWKIEQTTSKRAMNWLKSHGMVMTRISDNSQIRKGNQPEPMLNTFNKFVLPKGPKIIIRNILKELKRLN